METDNSHLVTTLGAVLYTGLGFLAVLVYGIGNLMAYQAIQSEGAADAGALATAVTVILVAKAVAVGVALLGIVLGGLGIIAFGDRRRWIWWAFMVGSIPMLAIFPVGTIIAALVLLTLFSRRGEFLDV